MGVNLFQAETPLYCQTTCGQPLVCGNVDNILCLRRKHLLGHKQVSTSIVWGTMIRDVNRNFD